MNFFSSLVSISSPSGEGGGFKAETMPFAIKVSISSPSGEGGGFCKQKRIMEYSNCFH